MACTIIACNTLRDEVELVTQELKCAWPILWVDSGLHDNPSKLKMEIQARIDSVEEAGDILLMFGVCGNSVLGLVSNNSRLIMPLVDDCISLFLGGNDSRKALEKSGASYYLTRGYLKNEKNIWKEYLYTLDKYGPEKAKMIYDALLHNYTRLIMIDTGAYDIEEIKAESDLIAKTFGLAFGIVTGKLDILYKAIKQQWDEDFMKVAPEQVVDYYDLGILKNE
jgi:hypothetical protein